MSKIDELIAELCPEGVFFITLGDFVDFIGGHSFPAAEFNTEKRGLRVIRIGDVNSDNEGVFYDGEFPKKALVLDGDLLMSLSGDLNLITWSRGDSLLNQRVAKLVVNPEKSISRYVFHFLKLNLGALIDATSKSVVANLSMASLRSFKIPLPPLEVQREIVAILGKFTQLEAELEAELEARRSQYEHTRDQLLDFSGDLSSHPLGELIAELCPEGVPKRTVSDLFAYEQPTPYLVSSSNYGASGCPVLTAGQTFLLGYTLETDGIFQASENRPVIIFDDFTTAFKWVDFPFKAKSSAMKMIQASSGSSIELRFLFYLMGVLNYIPGQHARHWISVFSNFEIPWPPLQVQREIVSILDKLDALVNDLSFGLPAEIAARRKQYEHYRNKLLAFKELETA
jgi:type I restriction enzyme S subunit